jgi:N-acetylglucosamine kinase-like BadF-type ATPase
MPFNVHSVGVDLGGTWIRLEAIRSDGRRAKSFKALAPGLSHLPAFLKKTLKRLKLRPRHLVVASRGIWTRPERQHLKKSLLSLAQNVQVMSDVEAAWHAAFRSDETGVIVIAGTGSIAFGRDSSGRSQRAGGWGPVLGDEGSAFWLGKTWLKRTKGHDSILEILRLMRPQEHAVRRIAGLAPRVVRLARRGDRIARSIIQEAQAHLAEIAVHAAEPLRAKSAVHVSWGGSLLDNAYFREGFASALRRAAPKGRPFQMTEPRTTAVAAISRLPVLAS